MKAKCGSCTMFFCPRCLLNRYGEEVEKVCIPLHVSPAELLKHQLAIYYSRRD